MRQSHLSADAHYNTYTNGSGKKVHFHFLRNNVPYFNMNDRNFPCRETSGKELPGKCDSHCPDVTYAGQK